MKRAMLLLVASVMPGLASAADVGVSISIGEPGFYGQIDIGDFPRPSLVFPQPVVIQPVPVGVVIQPVYLRVPPGHAKNWSAYCHQYSACGRPVYFVQDSWYNDVYVPGYRSKHGGGNGHGAHGNSGHGNDSPGNSGKHGKGKGH